MLWFNQQVGIREDSADELKKCQKMSWQRNVFSISLKNSIDNCYFADITKKVDEFSLIHFLYDGHLLQPFFVCSFFIASAPLPPR
jgi:hypothetical protein